MCCSCPPATPSVPTLLEAAEAVISAVSDSHTRPSLSASVDSLRAALARHGTDLIEQIAKAVADSRLEVYEADRAQLQEAVAPNASRLPWGMLIERVEALAREQASESDHLLLLRGFAAPGGRRIFWRSEKGIHIDLYGGEWCLTAPDFTLPDSLRDALREALKSATAATSPEAR